MPSDIFAKLGDIKGESLDAKHKDEIEVLSFSWGVDQHRAPRAPAGAAGPGKATFHDLSFVHHIDKASPLLLKACATGTHLKEATITHRKAGKDAARVPDRQDERHHHHRRHAQRRRRPARYGSEMVTLSFAKVDLEYKTQKPNGSLDARRHFKYDLKANKTF